MTTESQRKERDDIPDAMFEDAAVWRARMEEPLRDPSAVSARQAEFERWLAADARHALAFEESKRLWDALKVPTARAMAPEETPAGGNVAQRRAVRRATARPALMAACVAVLIAIGVLGYDDLSLRLNSDHRTTIGEQTRIALEDGSRVTLNTDTAIAVDFETNRRRIQLLRGEAWFDVTTDGDRPFVVETPAGRIRVTGTSFGVRLRGDAAVVSLTEGRVDLLPEDAQTVRLAAGREATLSHDGVSTPAALDNTAATAWLRGQLVFYNARLADVIAELNRYRSGRIVVTNGELDDLRINGVFSTDDPDTALDAIANTLPVRVIRLTDFLVLLH